MAIESNNQGGLFGTNNGNKRNGSTTRTNANGEFTKAQVWLNVGYQVGVEVVDEQGNKSEEQRFVSLPVGIPLDTTERLKPVQNADFNALISARNDLLDQILEAAKSLAPGEDKIIALNVQIRRVNDEAVAVEREQNPYAIKLEL